MWICGIDEAGKGPVLGPMVAAGVCVEDTEPLAALGIKDSKQLSAKKREDIFSEIIDSCRTAIVIRTPAEIDAREGTMNQFTVQCHADVLRELKPDIVYLDACDVNAARFGENVLSASGLDSLKLPPTVVSEHKADARYVVVGAASIVAKVTRDRIIESLKEEFGDIGSGYPSDAKTVTFLNEYVTKHGDVPSCARKSWQTVIDLLDKKKQTSLEAFF